MSIEDLANHVANLVTILDFWEDIGGPKPKTLTDELHRSGEELLKAIEERNANEARSRDVVGAGQKDGAGSEQSVPVRSSPVGPSPVSARRETLRRPGIGSTNGQNDSAPLGNTR